MATGINDLLSKIEAAEKEVKKRYPKQDGKVRLMNAKSKIDYLVKENAGEFEWAQKYYEELNNIL